MTAGDVYRALWRHKLLIVVLTATFVVATWYATSLQTKTYEASTLVRIQQQGGDPGDTLSSLQAAEVLARTYAEMIDSGALDARIRARVSPRVSADEVGSVDVAGEPIEDLGLLRVSARDEDPAVAAVIANNAPLALRDFIASNGRLREQVVTLRAAGQPTSPASPNLGLNIALALVLALMFNGALALLFELFRDRLPETDALEEALGYPVLAKIPALRLRELKTGDAGSGGNGGSVAAGRGGGRAGSREP